MEFETARKIRQTHFVLDGEAVVLGLMGDADFDALHSRRHDHEVQLYAFDMLAGDALGAGAILSQRSVNCTAKTSGHVSVMPG